MGVQMYARASEKQPITKQKLKIKKIKIKQKTLQQKKQKIKLEILRSLIEPWSSLNYP